MIVFKPISRGADRVSASKTVNFDPIFDWVNPGQTRKTRKWVLQFPCLTFSVNKESVNPPTCVVKQVAA